jgi:hypothetical protein
MGELSLSLDKRLVARLGPLATETRGRMDRGTENLTGGLSFIIDIRPGAPHYRVVGIGTKRGGVGGVEAVERTERVEGEQRARQRDEGRTRRGVAARDAPGGMALSMTERENSEWSRRAGPGEIWTIVAKPPEWYAGNPGWRAVVEEVSETAIYVVFETGLRESFPPGRFATFFEPADIVDARVNLPATRAA